MLDTSKFSIDASGNLVVAPDAPAAPAATTPAPLQQTTTQTRTSAAQNSAALQTKVAQITPPPPAATDTTKTPAANASSTSGGMAQGNGATMNEATARAVFGTDFTGVHQNQDGTYTADDSALARINGAAGAGGATTPPTDPAALATYNANNDSAAAKAKAQKQADYATSTLDGLKTMSDAATAALIDSIKQTYGARISLMEDSNSRVLSAKNQEGLRSGRARYASTLQEGILSDEEQAGIGRVGQLQGEMLSLVAQAQQAQNKEDLDLFNTRMTDLSKIDDDLQNTLQGIQKNAFESLKALQDKQTADINNAKTQQDTVLARAKAVAPALATQLAAISDPAKQAAFLESYSKESGLSMDVLLGAVGDQQTDDAKSALDLKNIQNEIDNRNANTRIAQQNADRLAKGGEKDDGQDEVDNIINGISSIGEVDASKKQVVKAKLQTMGLYNSTPPNWYVQAQNDQFGGDMLPEKIQASWDEYRKKATADDSE